MSTRSQSISVVIPTYDRAAELTRCLEGIAAQERAPEEVILVLRHEDHASEAVLDDFAARLPLRVARVDRQGLVQALRAGLEAARSDIVAFTDDDAVPRPGWLTRLERHFEMADVAAVGGRDVLHRDGRIYAGPLRLARLWPEHRVVGRVQRVGRVTGNHHLASGRPREVDVLKGANMAYRRGLLACVGFDERVRGSGSQVHNELSACLPLRAAGWRIVFDPEAAVDHYPAPRQHGDHRDRVDVATIYDQTFNEELAVWAYLTGGWRVAHLVWATLVGTAPSPGLLQLPRLALRTKGGGRALAAARRARRAARRAVRSGAPRSVLPPRA